MLPISGRAVCQGAFPPGGGWGIIATPLALFACLDGGSVLEAEAFAKSVLPHSGTAMPPSLPHSGTTIAPSAAALSVSCFATTLDAGVVTPRAVRVSLGIQSTERRSASRNAPTTSRHHRQSHVAAGDDATFETSSGVKAGSSTYLLAHATASSIGCAPFRPKPPTRSRRSLRRQARASQTPRWALCEVECTRTPTRVQSTAAASSSYATPAVDGV